MQVYDGDVPDWVRADMEDLKPTPPLRELLGVVAIGQTVSRGHVTFTLFSLESYAEGFAVEGRRRLEEGHPMLADIRRRREEFRRNVLAAYAKHGTTAAAVEPHRPMFGQPRARMHPTATDDLGNRYRSRQVHGSGKDDEERFLYAFAPQLDPAARGVRIEISDLHWLVEGPDGYPSVAGDTDPGPWSFDVPLQTATP